jgi:lysozyme family protein
MVGATADGAIGPATLRAVNAYVQIEGIESAIETYQNNRQGYYEKLKTFETFGRGWTRRVKETTEEALKMC